ncbi:MAG: hypothetical protein ABIP71_15635, partial [Verrucomicrobiota bacterium]
LLLSISEFGFNKSLRFFFFFFRSAFGARFGFPRFGNLCRCIFAAFAGEFFFTGLARFCISGGFFAAFTRESGLSQGQRGYDCGNSDVTE